MDYQLSTSVDKSTVGCYVYLDGKLSDVMVINELEQTLNFKLNEESQIVQIIVQQLGEGEIKYGK